MKIDFNKWWNNYDKKENREKRKIRRFVNKEVKFHMRKGNNVFVIDYMDYNKHRTYLDEYINELGLIIHHVNPYPFCKMTIKIPEREE